MNAAAFPFGMCLQCVHPQRCRAELVQQDQKLRVLGDSQTPEEKLGSHMYKLGEKTQFYSLGILLLQDVREVIGFKR